MSENRSLAVVQDFGLPALDDSFGQAMAEEMEGLQISFDRVKIPTGGGLAFEVPGDDPENPDMVKEIVGVIVDHYPVNAYWAEKFAGQNTPPDCSALDGKNGTGNPGGNCKTCPNNQWGSDPEGTGGKACKNMHRIYILREGDVFPLLLTLPPTSLKNFADYLAKRVIGKRRRSYQVLTKISLKKATSNGGITYSQAVFSVARVLSEEAARKAEEYAKNIRPLTRSLEIVGDEYNTGDSISSSDAYEDVM